MKRKKKWRTVKTRGNAKLTRDPEYQWNRIMCASMKVQIYKREENVIIDELL